MDKDMVNQVMDAVMKRLGDTPAPAAPVAEKASGGVEPCFANIGVTEFVGTAQGHTIGAVIANVDPILHQIMGLDPKYRSIGIISDRIGAGPQIMATDEAVKATNTEVLSIELPRDTEGGAGHGCLILLRTFRTPGGPSRWRSPTSRTTLATCGATRWGTSSCSTPRAPATP